MRISSPVLLPLFAIAVLGPVDASASPLTSAEFASAYGEHSVVAAAQSSGRADELVGEFLAGDAPVDEKAAVVNALGWQNQSDANARRFLEAVASREGVSSDDLEFAHFAPPDRFVLGYLLAMSDYLELRPLDEDASGVLSMSPRDWLAGAAALMPDDFTVHYIRALVEAQVALYEVNLCAVWLFPHEVLERFPESERDLRPAAVEAGWAYVSEYGGHCRYGLDEPEGGDVRMNWIYDILGYRDWIVTGTQHGVVVWDPEQSEPVHTAEEFICGTLVVWEDSVWAGCDERVYRFDGTEWRTYLRNNDNDANYYAPILGPGGELFVQYGGEGFVYSPESDQFERASVPDGYDVLYASGGGLWQVDFLSGISSPQGFFAINTREYPGSNPRAIYEGPTGVIWVADFDDGYFQFDQWAGVFHAAPGPQEKGTALALDPAGARVWMAHYTDGVTLAEGGSLRHFDLSRLENIRDLHLDEDGSLWVAGWGELVRLSQEGGDWREDSWAIE